MDSRAERLLTELVELTGEDGSVALHRALEERMERVRQAKQPAPDTVPEEVKQRRREAIARFQAEMAKLPILDHRDPDDIIGYNDIGAFD